MGNRNWNMMPSITIQLPGCKITTEYNTELHRYLSSNRSQLKAVHLKEAHTDGLGQSLWPSRPSIICPEIPQVAAAMIVKNCEKNSMDKIHLEKMIALFFIRILLSRRSFLTRKIRIRVSLCGEDHRPGQHQSVRFVYLWINLHPRRSYNISIFHRKLWKHRQICDLCKHMFAQKPKEAPSSVTHIHR